MAKRKRKKKKKKGGRGSATGAPPELPAKILLLVETPVAKLDLHRLTAHQAELRIRNFVRTQSRISAGKVVHIVTGKGTRSAGAPILPSVTQQLLSGELSDLVSEVGGLPGGGALAVRLS